MVNGNIEHWTSVSQGEQNSELEGNRKCIPLGVLQSAEMLASKWSVTSKGYVILNRVGKVLLLK